LREFIALHFGLVLITRRIFPVFPHAPERTHQVFHGIHSSPPLRHDLSPKFTAPSGRRLFYRDISFLDWISTFIYKEIYEKFQQELIIKEHINVIKGSIN